MVDKKRKSRDEMTGGRVKSKSSKLTKGSGDKKKKKKSSIKGQVKKRTGPRLPNALLKEMDRSNRNGRFDDDEDEDLGFDVGKDLYEYEEEVPEEEAKKNRRFDSIKNFEYELPEDFKDENVLSDDIDEFEDEDDGRSSGDDEDEDDIKHKRMLKDITQLPSEAFEGGRKRNEVVISEPYPESEYNPTRDILDGDGQVTLEELMESLQKDPSYSKLRKEMRHTKSIMPLSAPLPTEVKNKVERQKAYDISKKEITKWESLIKRNREAHTLIFDKDIDVGFSTVGAIASEFEPRTEFEKKMASIVYNDRVIEAHKEDGAKLLELNKISMEDYKNSREHTAKMRSLLFRHEMKMKRLKKIKSKTHRRLLKKDRLKLASGEMQMDPEAAEELAMKQEFKRAEERLTLRHKNKSKWARRVLERGLDAQDEGTRAAMAEQLSRHNLLTRKMNSMNESSSSDDSSDEEYDENSDGSGQDRASKLLTKAKEKTLSLLEEEDEVPKSGVLSLPFMARGLKKQKDAAIEEAKLTLQEYESSLNQLEDANGIEETGALITGKRVFGGPTQKVVALPTKKRKSNDDSSDSDGESDFEPEDNIVDDRIDDRQKEVNVSYSLLNEDSESHEKPLFVDSESLTVAPSTKTTNEVSILTSNKWRKMNKANESKSSSKAAPTAVQPIVQNEISEEIGEDSDNDDGAQMIDGKLASGYGASPYELPSQADLIHEAFAGDDVEEEFARDKDEALNVENPEPEKPLLLPGWGQWTNVQKKKGLPSWMEEEHKLATRKRDEAIKKRKDAHLKHVIISEKIDNKTKKLHATTLPYPFTCKEVFEQSIRNPLGPDFNPASTVAALIRPEVMKKPGVIIKPINYEDVDPHAKTDNRQSKNSEKKKQPKRSNSAKRQRLKPLMIKS
ncbi:U3 small nucleolar RNA-associated protein 14 [Linum perenne]